MTERGNKKSPLVGIIMALLLVLFMAFQEVIMNSISVEESFRMRTLWGVIKFVLAVGLWRMFRSWFIASGYWTNEKLKDYKSAISPLLVILVIFVGTSGSFLLNRVLLKNQSYIDLNLLSRDLMLCGIFIYLAVIIVGRNLLIALVKLVSGKDDELPRRIATGFADGVLIFLHPIAFVLYRLNFVSEGFGGMLKADMGRLLFLGVVISSLRIAWGFVPEDRLEIVREFIEFLRERKLWWMTPIFIVLGLLIVLVLLTQSTGNFPFIYAVF